jgi:hypothetical protein
MHTRQRFTVIFLSALLIGSFTVFFAKKTIIPLLKEQITAETLWNRIKKEDSYLKYSYWFDHKGMQPGKAPHGPYHKIFINSVISGALPIFEKIIPEGGIIVMEAYDPDKEIITINAMAKVKDYNTNDGDWFWAQYSTDGKPVISGKPGSCISCHKDFINNDYLIVHKLDK